VLHFGDGILVQIGYISTIFNRRDGHLQFWGEPSDIDRSGEEKPEQTP